MQMIFKLDNAAQQPTVILDKFYGIRALIDTGSMLPMWIKDRFLLEVLGGKNTGLKRGTIGTAGNRESEIYRLTVTFGDIVYADMPILLNPIKSPNLENIQLIFGATNFRNMQYTIDNPSNQKIINVKTLNVDGAVDILSST